MVKKKKALLTVFIKHSYQKQKPDVFGFSVGEDLHSSLLGFIKIVYTAFTLNLYSASGFLSPWQTHTKVWSRQQAVPEPLKVFH